MNKKSSIWYLEKDHLQKITNESKSLTEILKKLEKNCNKTSFSTLKRVLLQLKINYSHIPVGINSNKNRKFLTKNISLTEVLVENSSYKRGSIKKRLIEEGYFIYKCVECGLKNEWNNKKLVLQLDHINGIPNDNRIENLRFLCPNCHSQTPTFAGRASRKETFGKPSHKLKDKKCPNCNVLICDVAERCGNCRIRPKKINWPPFVEIEDMLKEMPMTAVAKKLGVSDNAVKKHIRSKKKT